MKHSILFLLLLVVGACAPLSREPGTNAPIVAPTVKAPPKAKPVNLTPSRDVAKAVGESSLQLKGRIQAMRETNYMLSRDLDRAIKAGSATAGELERMRAKAVEQEVEIDEMARINTGLLGQVRDLEESLVLATAEAEGQRQNVETLYSQLQDANGKLVELTLMSGKIENELDSAREELSGAEASHKEIVKVKNAWIKWALIYGMGLTGVILFCVGAFFYIRSNPASAAGRVLMRALG